MNALGRGAAALVILLPLTGNPGRHRQLFIIDTDGTNPSSVPYFETVSREQRVHRDVSVGNSIQVF